MPVRKKKIGPFNYLLGKVGLVMDTALEVVYALKTEIVMVACTIALITAIQAQGRELPIYQAKKLPPPTKEECAKLQFRFGIVAGAVPVLIQELNAVDGLTEAGYDYLRHLPEGLSQILGRLCPHLVPKVIYTPDPDMKEEAQ